MKKYTPIYLYGAVTVLEGIFLLFSRDSSFHLIKMTTGVTLTIGALIAFYAYAYGQPHLAQPLFVRYFRGFQKGGSNCGS